MAFNFKKVAQDTTILCPVMTGREKLETQEVLERELTIIEFGFAPKYDQDGGVVLDETGKPDTFGVVVFKEMPEFYYCVGAIFTKVCKAWAASFDSPEEASKALAEEGGVRVKFTPSKTKRGKKMTAVEILD